MKKFISFVLTVFVLASSCVTVFAEDTASAPEVFTDKEVSEETISWLEALGVMLPDSDGYITRGEFILAVTDILGISAPVAAEAVFADVDAKTKLGAAVYNAVNMGLISKADAFNPDNEISYAEGCKILIHLLGYVPDAQIHGGWPTGYLYVADKLDLNLSMSSDKFRFYDFCEILKRASMTEIRDVVGVDVEKGETNLDYTIGDTFAEVYHNMSYIDGIIEANSLSHIYNPNAPSDENSLMIEGHTYYCTDWADYQLGMYVYGYIKEIGGKNTIIQLWTDENTVTEIHSVDSPFFSNGKLIWYEGDKEKSVSISSETALIYNGKTKMSYNNNIYKISDGRILLISNDGDNKPEAVHILKTDFIVVASSSRDAETITDRNTGTVFKLSDSEYFFEGFSFTDLKEGSALEYVKSEDGKFYSFKLLKKTVSANVSGLGESDKLIYLDDKAYEYSSYFDTWYKGAALVGSGAKMYLSSEGKLVKMELTSGNELMYAYAFDYAYSGESLDKYYAVRCFTEDGEIEVLRLDEKLDYNGSSKNASEVLASLESIGETLIRYRLSGDKVKKIVTDDGTGTLYNAATDGPDALKRYHFAGYDDATTKQYYRTGYYVPFFMVSNNTKIFCVKTLASETDVNKRFKLGSGTAFLGNNVQVQPARLMAYNVGDDGYADAIVYVQDTADRYLGTLSANVALVHNVAEAIDSDEELSWKLTLVWNDYYFDKFVKKDNADVLSYIEEREHLNPGDCPFVKGDVIRYNEDGEYITDFNRDFEADIPENIMDNKLHNLDINYYYGELDTVTDSAFSFNCSNPLCRGFYFFSYGDYIEIVTKDGGVTPAPRSKLSSYVSGGLPHKGILVRCKASQVTNVIIYE